MITAVVRINNKINANAPPMAPVERTKEGGRAIMIIYHYLDVEWSARTESSQI